MKDCFNLKSNCTSIILSTCVDWAGKELDNALADVLRCNLSMTDVIEKMDSVITEILNSIDISKFVSCNNGNNETIANVFNNYLDLLTKLKYDFDQLRLSYNSFDISTQKINIDTSCLTGESDCFVGDKTIFQLFDLLLTEVCYLKNK